MMIRGLLFTLNETSSGKVAGRGLVHPATQYAAVKWRDDNAIDRRTASATVWTAIVEQIANSKPGAALPPDSALSRLLHHDDEFFVVHCLALLTLDDTSRPPEQADLDAILNARH